MTTDREINISGRELLFLWHPWFQLFPFSLPNPQLFFTPGENTGKSLPKTQKTIGPKTQPEHFGLPAELLRSLSHNSNRKARNNKKIQVAATVMKRVFQV